MKRVVWFNHNVMQRDYKKEAAKKWNQNVNTPT